MRKYEIMYVLRADLAEEDRQTTIDFYADVLTRNGATIVDTDDWGIRDLAYDIERQSKGYYVVLKVEAGNEAIDEFNRLARINEQTIRFITINDENK